MLAASFYSVQMKDVDMMFNDNVDHKFVNTMTRADLWAGYSPDHMEL